MLSWCISHALTIIDILRLNFLQSTLIVIFQLQAHSSRKATVHLSRRAWLHQAAQKLHTGQLLHGVSPCLRPEDVDRKGWQKLHLHTLVLSVQRWWKPNVQPIGHRQSPSTNAWRHSGGGMRPMFAGLQQSQLLLLGFCSAIPRMWREELWHQWLLQLHSSDGQSTSHLDWSSNFKFCFSCYLISIFNLDWSITAQTNNMCKHFPT